MDLDMVVGKYEEVGTWKDSDGNSGELMGNFQEIRFHNSRLYFVYAGAEETQISDEIESHDRPIRISNKLGEGRIFIGDKSITLEYTADVDGRVERNTDIWCFGTNSVQRYGLIRQDTRTIWFEAVMKRVQDTVA
jgi:hypothetical protein|tara:strand:- start:991 stop:1395 length:405 start_codon:yes stop_codon:yes gene_type:complete